MNNKNYVLRVGSEIFASRRAEDEVRSGVEEWKIEGRAWEPLKRIIVIMLFTFTSGFIYNTCLAKQNTDKSEYTMLYEDSFYDDKLKQIDINDNKKCLLKYPGIVDGNAEQAYAYWKCRANSLQDRRYLGELDNYNSKRIDYYIKECNDIAVTLNIS